MSNYSELRARRASSATRAYLFYSSGFQGRLPKVSRVILTVILLTLGYLYAQQRPETPELGRPQLVWQGKLEGTHDLVIQNDRVTVEDISGPPVQDVRYRFVTPLPATEVTLDVDPRVSRGWVHTVQEPTIDNSYKLRVRIEDRQSGEYFYSIAIAWHKLYNEPDNFSMTKSHRSRKNTAPRDAAWVVDGERRRISCGAIWTGAVRETARIAIGGREARFVLGHGTGNLEMMGGTSWPKGAYLPMVMATSAGTRVEVVDNPTAKNDYTLVIEVRTDQPAVKIEIAW